MNGMNENDKTSCVTSFALKLLNVCPLGHRCEGSDQTGFDLPRTLRNEYAVTNLELKRSMINDQCQERYYHPLAQLFCLLSVLLFDSIIRFIICLLAGHGMAWTRLGRGWYCDAKTILYSGFCFRGFCLECIQLSGKWLKLVNERAIHIKY